LFTLRVQKKIISLFPLRDIRVVSAGAMQKKRALNAL
jgi:hypothetical protein